ncbi:MAG: hypothetical protein SAJ37_17670 [Oscillatoria sp. PMC 1068.18]|nr:hypothetical protein [Oscillatoria sp. PMC 1068.18]
MIIIPDVNTTGLGIGDWGLGIGGIGGIGGVGGIGGIGGVGGIGGIGGIGGMGGFRGIGSDVCVGDIEVIGVIRWLLLVIGA